MHLPDLRPASLSTRPDSQTDIGKYHSVYQSLLPFFTDVFGYPRQGHNKQLYGHILEAQFHFQLFKRSIFGMVDVYNALSQEMVDLKSVKDFQSELTKFARARCVAGDANWISSFAGRWTRFGMFFFLLACVLTCNSNFYLASILVNRGPRY